MLTYVTKSVAAPVPTNPRQLRAEIGNENPVTQKDLVKVRGLCPHPEVSR